MKERDYTWKYFDKSGNYTGYVTVSATSRMESSNITGLMQMRGETPKGNSILWKVNGRKVNHG